jgi:hypothetical protein
VTAGFGDTGFCGHWTLEMTVVRPLRIYPFLPICQVYFHEVKGTVENYRGKYAGNKGVQPSMLWKDYERDDIVVVRCGRTPPIPGSLGPGHGPCTRVIGHDGPCAHP